MKIGITGNTGFIGTHLTDYLKRTFEIVPFEKDYFLYQDKLNNFVKQSDVIIHLAGRSKPHDSPTIYHDNMNLSHILLDSIKEVGFKGHLIFVSSVHEMNRTHYGNSKYTSRFLFSKMSPSASWSKGKNYKFTGLILPNVFGPGAKVENSFITNWICQLYYGETPEIFKDVEIELIYIEELVKIFPDVIKLMEPTDYYLVKPTSKNKLSYILNTLILFNEGNDWMAEDFELNLNKTWKRDLATLRF